MNTKRNWTIVGMGLFWICALLVVPFLAQPVTATAPSSVPDVARIDAFVREQVRRHGIPGLAMALVDGDKILYMGGYGKADQSGRAATPQTPFILASVSKPMTALAVMQLVEAGRVELDVPVQRYLPEFRVADAVASEQITVRHLLQHTSGIGEPGCMTRAGAETLEQFVAELQTVELVAPVGTRHEYCSGNYNVLGHIIERVSGQTFAAYMQQHVFAPLEMRHSFASEQQARQDGLAQGYQWLFGAPVATHYRFNPSQLPSGYLISSAEDMAHFLVAQLNGGRYGSSQILSPEGIAAMHAPGVAIGGGEETYGLGWKTGSLGGVPVVQHDGVNFEFHSLLFIEPETRRGAVLLMNSFGIVPYLTAYKEIEAGVARLLAGQEPAAASLSLRTRYLIIDAPLAALFTLALWPLVRLRHWYQRVQQRHTGRLPRLRLGLRLGWEFGLSLVLLVGTRLLIGLTFGAQSWSEVLVLFPDFGAWIWALSLVMLTTGAIRLTLVLRILRRTGRESRVATGVPASRRPA